MQNLSLKIRVLYTAVFCWMLHAISGLKNSKFWKFVVDSGLRTSSAVGKRIFCQKFPTRSSQMISRVRCILSNGHRFTLKRTSNFSPDITLNLFIKAINVVISVYYQIFGYKKKWWKWKMYTLLYSSYFSWQHNLIRITAQRIHNSVQS